MDRHQVSGSASTLRNSRLRDHRISSTGDREVQVREAVEQLDEGHLDLEVRECGADATMRAPTECEVGLRGVTVEVELPHVGEANSSRLPTTRSAKMASPAGMTTP